MNGRGRPLRFVALVTMAWAGARVAILWPEGATLVEAIEHAFPVRTAEARVTPPAVAAPPVVERLAAVRPVVAVAPTRSYALRGEQARIDLAVLGLVQFGPEQAFGAPPGATREQVAPGAIPDRAAPSRWSGSAWFVTRRGAPAGGAMLGGDQMGARVAYALDEDRRLALYARATAPLGQRGREIAAGVEWRPTALPVRVVAEQRFGLDGNRGGPAVGVIGGVDGVVLPADLRLEAYGQAGAVWRGRVEPFADGAVRVTHEVARAGQARLDVGGSVWGAAQREAVRLDMGPGAVATVPVGGSAVRVSLDWRERVAGDARPGSGPALTVGTDF